MGNGQKREISRMSFLFLPFLLLLTNSCLAYRKNVLMIIADDLRPNLNSYLPTPSFSSPEIHTPNLDELAASSTVFNRAYVQYALCGPSRNSFLTGRRPDTTRCYAEHRFRARGLDVAVTLPQYFKENGYMTLGMGKVWHPGMPGTPAGDDYPKSWNEKMFHTNSTDDSSFSWKAYTEEEMEETTLRVLPDEPSREVYARLHCHDQPVQIHGVCWPDRNSAETEEQQPNWGDVHEWGELYDLEADPQENVNLYRDHDYLELKVQMRKLLHAGWYDHN